MTGWVTPGEMADLDRRAVAAGTTADVLMETAGNAVAELATRMLPRPGASVEIHCGPGNNGGDGFVAARVLRRRGFTVRAVLASDSASSISTLCMKNLVRFREEGGEILGINHISDLAGVPDLGIDALLGTGFHGILRGPVAESIPYMRRCGSILAVDTPTGLNGDDGTVDPLTPRASVTITLAAPKLGCLLAPGCSFAGALFNADIGIDVPARRDREVFDFEAARGALPARPVDAHKGDFGRLLLLGGAETMPGAPLLMALGALRAGAGLAKLFVPYPAAGSVFGRIPEVVCGYFLPGDTTSLPDPSGVDCIALGPGMGDSVGTSKIVRHALSNWHLPMVLDADALNVLSSSVTELAVKKGPLVLTPHAGELQRLAGREAGSREELWEIASVLSKATGAVILLKGRPTVRFAPDGGRALVLCGNSGLATGGSGDILTGMVAAFVGQGLDPATAAAEGAFIHGLAADILAAGTSSRSMMPTDVADSLGSAFRLLEDGPPAGLLRMEGRWNGRLWNHP